jgi:16S rRNA (guanine527-N7)-methyltransferase
MSTISPPPAFETDSERTALIKDSASLGVTLDERAARQLLGLLDELSRWNKTYNLTAIGQRRDMVVRHLLDSLAVWPLLEGSRVIDVGTGAGFPGLPLAIADPHRQFTLLDSNGKKVRFVAHAARTLELGNVQAVHARAETHTPSTVYDTVVTRAFAPLPELLDKVAGLCGPHTLVLAMKGRRQSAEREGLPAGWRIEADHDLIIPGLAEARHVVVLRRMA